MPKLPDCDRCQRYSFTPHLICAIHPTGPDSAECWDFAPNAATAIASDEDELRFPGAASYNGELIPESHSRLTREEQLELLATHPLFTGKCPQCGYMFSQKDLPVLRWDCQCCGWVDETV